MAKPENNENFPEKQTWGTWEELLLACAIHRYGTDSWDSVAAEIRNRTSALRTLTPLACQQKYNDLKRRFSQNHAMSETADDTTAEIAAVPWLEELRKLRVAELRSEVKRYDLSISSLQLKVKKLEDERQRSLKENETETQHSDLDKIGVEEMKERHGEQNKTAREPVHERLNRSVNESNSTDPKDENPRTGTEDANRKRVKVEPETGEPNRTGGDAKLGGEDSCRGSCESVGKESAANSERLDSGREAGDSPELFESVAESMEGGCRGEEEAKESSDVQSSASLPRKEKKAAEPDERDNEDQFPAVKRIPAESQPLADILEILQAHALGSHFSRRLESQETPDYSKLIRHHIDLETIRTRLEEGWYFGSQEKFFRDLLLLVNNATLFYGKGSSEFVAAGQLRQLVMKEMALKIPKQNPPPKDQSPVAPESADSELDTKPSHPLSLKPRMSVPLTACRKRSSLAPRLIASGPEKHMPKTAPLIDEKPVLEMKEQDETQTTSDKDEELFVSKKRMRERPSSLSVKKGNRSVKNCSNSNSSLNVCFSSKGRSSNDSSVSKKADKDKKTNASASSKKQSAASFLKRMKGGSSSGDGPLQETVKSSGNGKRGGTEQKKNNSNNDKGGAVKGQSTQKRSNGKKQANEKGSSRKKSTRRVTKRGATPSSAPAKRGRETAEKETGSSARAKKRSRR